MDLLKQFKSKVEEFRSARNGVVFWAAVGEIILFWVGMDFYERENIIGAVVCGILAVGVIILIARVVLKTTTEVNRHEKTLSDLLEGDPKQIINAEVFEEKVHPILYVFSDKVYEIPRLEIDKWAKSDPTLRAKLEKIVSNHSLRAVTNSHLLPEDRRALGMHIVMDIGQEVYEDVYPAAISQAIEKMGEAFEKYHRSDLKRKDLEGKPNKHYIMGD